KLDENGKPVTVASTCYYTESLPDFVRKLYTFSIGLISISAVLMIMIAGLKWIFAAGSPGTISKAQEDIKVAIIAVLLSLSSYVILNTINPRLTNISLPGVSPIATKDIIKNNICRYIFDKKHAGKMLYVVDINDKKLDLNTEKLKCGNLYRYGTFSKDSAGKDVFDYVGDCTGDEGCKTGDVCIQLGNSYFCKNPAVLCEKETEIKRGVCEEMNEHLVLNNIKSCAYRIDPGLILNKNNCTWDKRIFCPSGTVRTNCITGPEYDTQTKTGCWYYKDKQQAPLQMDKTLLSAISIGVNYCSDSVFANQDGNFVCCIDNAGTYKTYGKTLWWLNKSYTPDCGKITKCEVGLETDGKYESQDALGNDPCRICL
ncbi:MAG: pilin, partial [Patescibacteria group bacterium]